MNPVITKMEHFAIIVNNFWSLSIIVKSPIFNVVGFLDQPLLCNKFAAKNWSKPKRMVVYTCIT